MRKVVCVVTLIGLTVFSACESKKIEDATTVEEPSAATDMAETTAAPIDTAGMMSDSVTTSGDSTLIQK